MNVLSPLATYNYPCFAEQPLPETIVLLHGWGCASDCWQPLIPELQSIANVIAIDLPGFGESEPVDHFDVDSVLSLIESCLPEKAILIGWSLGGMLAVQLAAKYPQKITRIVTLAANAKFVADDVYTSAMSFSVNQQFNESVTDEAPGALKIFSGLLAQGDANERALLKKMRHLIAPEKINANWLQALQLLSQLDNRSVFMQLSQPGLHCFAEKDSLVPAAAAQALMDTNPTQQINLIPAAAHALHWSKPDEVARAIKQFLLGDNHSQTFVIDKRQMAKSFSRAATTYDSVAALQRQAGERLLKRVACSDRVDVVLDLGCGTGYFGEPLQTLFPSATLMSIDIAEGMVKFAKEKSIISKSPECGSAFVCADAECLPLAGQSVDIIFSNFALQWCENLAGLLCELKRVLKPQGRLVFTTLGSLTLRELKSAWQQVDALVHVNPFHQKNLLLDLLRQYHFDVASFESDVSVMEFEQLSGLTRNLKYLGAHNVNRGRAEGLTGRKKIEALKQAYEKCRRNDLLPATYEVFYIQAIS